MIDLTPLDVRKKKGDFRRGLRGYDAPQVDDFLEIVADRLETLVRENLALRERVARFENQATDYREREKALTEALVTAQEMREEVRAQSAREADAARREAANDAVRIRADAQHVREREEAVLRRLRGRQLEFLQTYRAFLERELAELASTVRGLEMNGTMGDALMTPPRLPDAAAESGFAAADVVAPTPGGASTPQPGDEEWATPAPASPASSAPDTASVRAEPERHDATAAEQWAAGPFQPAAESAAAEPPEAELILSDDDVLTDDETLPGVLTGDAANDAVTGEPVPSPSQLPPAGQSGVERPFGAGGSGPTPIADSQSEPSESTDAVPIEDDLDLIPELEDLAERDELGPDDAARSLDVKPVEDAEPSGSDSKRSAPRRREVGDDTDNLLRSLFGDEH